MVYNVNVTLSPALHKKLCIKVDPRRYICGLIPRNWPRQFRLMAEVVLLSQVVTHMALWNAFEI